MNTYTLVTAGSGPERFEALYSGDRRIAQSDDGPFTAVEVLEAVSMDNISVSPEYVEITEVYDEGFVANQGWPKRLSEIPADARVA